jgi:hypothetical protein
MPAPRPRVPDIRSEQFEILDSARVVERFRDISTRNVGVRALSDEAQRRGGRFEDVADNVVGYRHTFNAAHPISPRPGDAGNEVEAVEFELQLQQYPSATADELAVGVATVRGGDNSASYPLLLEAPGGDFIAAREYTAVGDRIAETQSWWTSVTGCLTRECVTVCAQSIATCRQPNQTWLQYIGCIAWNCGGCWLKCLGCATCNCGWWCQWAVGCCHQ